MFRRLSSSSRLRLAALAVAAFGAVASFGGAGCGASTQPQLKVLSVERSVREPTRKVVLFVEVVNRAERPMHLQRLEYTFAAAGAQHPGGQVSLTRVVEPGGAVVVEVPVVIDRDTWAEGEQVTLAGRLFCEEDQLERSFPVTADVPAPDAYTP